MSEQYFESLKATEERAQSAQDSKAKQPDSESHKEDLTNCLNARFR